MSEQVALAVDRLVISVFQLNGSLLEAGEQITAPFGLTSARWQVLGALAMDSGALTIPQIAKRMGLSRQAVLKQIRLLADDGLVLSQVNQAHKRSDLWGLTLGGHAAYESIMASQRRLVGQWSKGLTYSELVESTRVLEMLLQSIQQAAGTSG